MAPLTDLTLFMDVIINNDQKLQIHNRIKRKVFMERFQNKYF